MAGRVALVTGGTRGIGAAISRMLKLRGYNVAANYAGNDVAAHAFKEETGIPVYKFDVSDFDAVKTAVAQGVHGIFLFSVGLTIVSIITLFFLKEIPLRGGRRRQEPVAEAVEEALAEESGLALAD